MADCFCSHRIEHHITADLQEVAVFLNEDGFKPSLKDVTNPPMSLVKFLGINAIKLSHSLRQVSIRGFDDQVIVIVHQAIGVANPVEALVNVSESAEKQFAVAIFLKNGFTIISSRCDVVKRSVILDS